MSNIAKLVIGSNKISPEKRHTNTTKLLSYTKNWLNLSNISNRKKIGIQTIIRSCSMGSLDKMMNESKSIHDNTIGDNHETIVYQLDKSNIFTEPLRNSPRGRSYGVSTGITKNFSENCLSDMSNLPNKHSTGSLVSLVSLCSLSSSDSIQASTSMIRRLTHSISNDTLLRYLSSYNIQSPRNDRFEGIVMCLTKK